MNLHKIKHIYLLGIGGIGMSALARYFNGQGVQVSGYDKTPTKLTDQLQLEGIDIHFSENPNKVPITPDLVVYTPAIPEENQELRFVKKQNYRLMKRSEVLGLITQNKFTIAVAGTHGKTSISSIIAHILKSSGFPVTAFIGGVCKNYQSNLINDPQSKAIIVEADEFDQSFLQLHPDIAVISSMDADHLDVYFDVKTLENSYKDFANQLKSGGSLIQKKGLGLPVKDTCKTFAYAINGKADFFADTIHNRGFLSSFHWHGPQLQLRSITYRIPGNHNIENATAAAAVASVMGLNTDQIKTALESYLGVERRFDIRVMNARRIYIDDYAHHPEELAACLSAVKDLCPDKKITGIFQPHLYSRTRDFADAFAQSLELLDELVLLDIYPARERAIPGVNSGMLLNKVRLSNKMLCSKQEALQWIEEHKPEVLVSMGAGDIDKLVVDLEKIMKET